MALTTKIEEAKEALPKFISNVSNTSALPNFELAEYQYLVPLIGAGLYNDLQAKYTAGTVAGDDIVLLKRTRLVAVAYAYKDGIALGHITLTDNGARKFSANGMAPVAKWEFEKLEATLLNTAYNASETLLNYLFEKKPQLWTDSNEYKQLTTLLIRTGTEFNEQYRIFQPQRTFFNVIKAICSDVQELYLNEGIGEDLLNYLIGLNTDDASLLKSIKYLKKALAFFSIKMCCLHYSVRFSDMGFTVLAASGRNVDSADDAGRSGNEAAMIEMKMDACEREGQDYLGRARTALVAYYKATPTDEFKAAFETGPLVGFVDPASRTSGNEKWKGVFRL